MVNYIKDNELVSKFKTGFQPGDSIVNHFCTSFQIFLKTFVIKSNRITPKTIIFACIIVLTITFTNFKFAAAEFYITNLQISGFVIFVKLIKSYFKTLKTLLILKRIFEIDYYIIKRM